MNVDAVITAIQKRGSDALDLRDAAHEACHALDAKVRGRWERERIHLALSKHCGDPGTMVYYEVRARAVEKLACERAGIEYDVSKWAGVCFMETMKSMGIALPSHEWIVEQITKHTERRLTAAMVDRIFALRSKP